jgi:hypothetical protein
VSISKAVFLFLGLHWRRIWLGGMDGSILGAFQMPVKYILYESITCSHSENALRRDMRVREWITPGHVWSVSSSLKVEGRQPRRSAAAEVEQSSHTNLFTHLQITHRHVTVLMKSSYRYRCPPEWTWWDIRPTGSRLPVLLAVRQYR